MRLRDRLDDEEATFASVVQPLIDHGTLEPLAEHDGDAQRWMDCDMCSYIENRFHHQLEPEAVTDDQRAAWSRRALASDERLWDPRRSEFDAAFWILDRGVRVGTLALLNALKEMAMDVDKVPETKASRAFRVFLEKRGEAREANGRRELLLRVLAARGFSPTKEERASIAALTDAAALDRCVEAAVTAASVGAVLARAGTSHHRRAAPARAPRRRAIKKPSTLR
jgi:hypothetical protein